MSGRRLDLSTRDRQPELMDQPGLDPRQHDAALVGLARVNGISRTAARLCRVICRRIPNSSPRPLRVLDVACGGGDVAIGLWRRLQCAGRPAEVHGCDLSPQAVEYAARRAAECRANVTFFERDVVIQALPGGYDVICSSLFLHHLSEEHAVQFLRAARESAGTLVIISDLVRSRLGYLLAGWGCRLLSRSPIVHNDGPLSVRAAFTIDETRSLAESAGMAGAAVSRCWPKRLLLVWKHPDDPTSSNGSSPA